MEVERSVVGRRRRGAELGAVTNHSRHHPLARLNASMIKQKIMHHSAANVKLPRRRLFSKTAIGGS